MPKDTRDHRGRRLPAPAIYRTYNTHAGIHLDQDVEVTYATKYQFVIRAITELRLAHPVRTIRPGGTARVSKMSIVFIDATKEKEHEEEL